MAEQAVYHEIKTVGFLLNQINLQRIIRVEPVFNGLLFKEPLSDLVASNRESEKKAGIKHWDVPYTHLKYYLSRISMGDMDIKIEEPKHPRFNFENHLDAKVEQSGSAFRLLDIGASTAMQWVEPLAKHGGKLELSLTTLADFPEIHAEMRKLMAFCVASELHRHFQPDYFDLIVSRGVIGQLDYAVAESVLLLKKGGEAMFCGSRPDDAIFNEFAQDNRFYKVLAADPPDYRTNQWFLHIQKK